MNSRLLFCAWALSLCPAWIQISAGQQPNVVQTSSSLRSLLGLPNHHRPGEPAPRTPDLAAEQLWTEPNLAAGQPGNDLETRDLPILQSVQEEFSSLDPIGTASRPSHFMRPIREIGLDIRSQGRLPEDRSVELQNYVVSDWTTAPMPELALLWQAPNIRYGQLYFEDVALERYGQTYGPYRQPYSSGAHFFCSFVSMPLEMLFAPLGSCDTPLRYCRPGNCTSLYRQRFIAPR